jgi:hypothetical protein
MKTITMLDVDSISKIIAKEENLTKLKFFPAVPAEQKYICKWLRHVFPFSPIPFGGKTESFPDRWTHFDRDSENRLYDTDKQVKSLGWYKVNDEEKTVTSKAVAYVYDRRSNCTSYYFNSNSELYDFITEVKNESKKTFISITISE